MKLICFLIFTLTPQVWAQTKDDFSDLEKVEKEEFGDSGKNKDDSANFDLKNSQTPTDDISTDKDLDKELEGLEEKPSKNDTVDLEKELGTKPEEKSLPQLETPVEQAETPEESPQAPAPEVQANQVPAGPVNSEDQVMEAQINRIYQRFMTHSTSDEEWAKIATEKKAAETYGIQRGDTLWDVSTTFFGSGHYWPKLWQLNDQITNPHIVRPGQTIKFFPGSISQAPRLEVAENGEAGEAPPPPPIEEKIESSTPPEIPPPEKESRPALKNIPSSLAPLVFSEPGTYDIDGIAVPRTESLSQEPSLPVSSYLSDGEPASVGEVVAMESDGANTAGTWQYIEVRLESPRSGEVLTAYDIGDSIRYGGTSYGNPVQFQGSVRVLERINDKEPIYRAQVTYALNQIRTGAKLTQEQIPHLEHTAVGATRAAAGEIVGGEFDAERHVLGLDSVVYLSVGGDQGLQVGDVVSVLRNEEVHNPASYASKPTEKIATIKIAKVTSNRSTGVIVESSEVVRPGDILGTAPLKTDSSPAPNSLEDQVL